MSVPVTAPNVTRCSHSQPFAHPTSRIVAPDPSFNVSVHLSARRPRLIESGSRSSRERSRYFVSHSFQNARWTSSGGAEDGDLDGWGSPGVTEVPSSRSSDRRSRARVRHFGSPAQVGVQPPVFHQLLDPTDAEKPGAFPLFLTEPGGTVALHELRDAVGHPPLRPVRRHGAAELVAIDAVAA